MSPQEEKLMQELILLAQTVVCTSAMEGQGEVGHLVETSLKILDKYRDLKEKQSGQDSHQS